MTNLSHFFITTTVSYKLTHNTMLCILTGLGSIFPDYIELALLPKRKKDDFINHYVRGYVFSKIHRKLFHWFVPYVVVAVIAVIVEPDILRYVIAGKADSVSSIISHLFSNYRLLINYSTFFFSLGVISHIALDSLSGKVPSINPFCKNFGISLIKTRSISEALFSTLLISFLLFV